MEQVRAEEVADHAQDVGLGLWAAIDEDLQQDWAIKLIRVRNKVRDRDMAKFIVKS